MYLWEKQNSETSPAGALGIWLFVLGAHGPHAAGGVTRLPQALRERRPSHRLGSRSLSLLHPDFPLQGHPNALGQRSHFLSLVYLPQRGAERAPGGQRPAPLYLGWEGPARPIRSHREAGFSTGLPMGKGMWPGHGDVCRWGWHSRRLRVEGGSGLKTHLPEGCTAAPCTRPSARRDDGGGLI